MIIPDSGFRGTHVYAATEETVFDYHGFVSKEPYLDHYFRKMKRFFPGWSATIAEPNDFMTPSFFQKYNCRAPEEYFSDPLPRAKAFVMRKCIRRGSCPVPGRQ